ncbi:hypothetical protein FEM48_Zijuj04G0000600 [Ziziphus jujuba var. spinosa]|uniref:RGS1-HXK1-interacting protein 1 n=1 Tax=Ziziphus jujuba var. spinosa TaxID=714518 RepID=A0A978VGN7_ZIZJJ|nr:hypothetical protein FEM48_Zijuj04G0000600 [Ziziphus jujuba var. spinosa]
MADAPTPSTSSSSASNENGASSSSSTITSMTEGLQRTVINSTDSALRSARSLHHSSQDFLSHLASNYKTFEHAFFNTIKEGLMTTAEHPTATVGVGVAATFLLLRGPRRFLFRHTLGRLQSEEAQFVKAEKNVKELSTSVDLMKKESRKLLERATLAEKDMKYGHTELMKAGSQIQHLAKSVYKVEAQAVDLMDNLREIPGREALRLRAEASPTSLGS